MSAERMPAVKVRFVAVPDHVAEAGGHGRGVCSGCAFVAPAETCGVMRARMVALGLPDCVGGFVYREELL